MDAKKVLGDIKKMLFGEDAPSDDSLVNEIVSDVKVDEVLVESVQDVVNDESANDISDEKIKGLQEQIDALKEQVATSDSVKEDMEAKLSKSNEGVYKLVELMERLLSLSTADPSDMPKENFRKHLADNKKEQVSKFQKAFEQLNNNKKI